ncbi:hypothetical protein HCN44_001379 [Aphidius gifuensis]|uniref:Uncharacterized protein n=1 Tax=Aphidius gifuensis TaxID=684658 RepID=A0A835CPN0_APHGI|nr:uncharacterized protein LOC122853450 [Aphidius gifuensis]KAF7992054.1 hypothetical protein HCN44_001379 [Aphidius gifuensis]
MSVCHPKCAKANQRKLDYEKKLQAEKKLQRETDHHYHDKTIRKQLTYSSSYSSSVDEQKNRQFKFDKLGTSEYQSDSNSNESIVLSHVILPDETSVTPVPSFTKKRHHNLLSEKTPKCTPQDVKKASSSKKKSPKHTKLSSKNPSPDNPRNDKTYDRISAGISLLVSDQSHHSEHNTDTTTGTTKYFDGYILANDSYDNEQDNFKYSSPSIKVNNKKNVVKSNKKHQDDDDDDDRSSQDNSSHYPSCPSLYENDNSTSAKDNKTNIKNKKSPREILFEQVKHKKEVEFVNHIGDWRCFDDLCFCSLKCTTNIFKDKFVKKIVTSAVFCCLGIRLCRELDSWYIPF